MISAKQMSRILKKKLATPTFMGMIQKVMEIVENLRGRPSRTYTNRNYSERISLTS